jgi:hypothetical protein
MPFDHVIHSVYIFGRVFRAMLQREDVIHRFFRNLIQYPQDLIHPKWFRR